MTDETSQAAKLRVAGENPHGMLAGTSRAGSIVVGGPIDKVNCQSAFVEEVPGVHWLVCWSNPGEGSGGLCAGQEADRASERADRHFMLAAS